MQKIPLTELTLFADNLQTSVDWLLRGEQSGMTEFIASLRGFERNLGGRGKREVLATAQREVAEYRVYRFQMREQMMFTLAQAGVPEDKRAAAVEASLRTILGPDYLAPEAEEPSRD